jgi:hypothetical protein
MPIIARHVEVEVWSAFLLETGQIKEVVEGSRSVEKLLKKSKYSRKPTKKRAGRER